MDAITLYINQDLLADILQLFVTYGVGGAFALLTVLILLTSVVYKALSLVGNTK